MRQVHAGAGRLERIDRPVPAIGRLQDDLRIEAGASHHRVQPVHVIDDPDRLQHLTATSGPHDHGAPPMKIDTNELLPCVL
jgi:hypothetical protein